MRHECDVSDVRNTKTDSSHYLRLQRIVCERGYDAAVEYQFAHRGDIVGEVAVTLEWRHPRAQAGHHPA